MRYSNLHFSQVSQEILLKKVHRAPFERIRIQNLNFISKSVRQNPFFNYLLMENIFIYLNFFLY